MSCSVSLISVAVKPFMPCMDKITIYCVTLVDCIWSCCSCGLESESILYTVHKDFNIYRYFYFNLFIKKYACRAC